MSSAESTSANAIPVIEDDVLVEHVLGMGVIPQLQSGDSYASNAIPALARRALTKHNLPAPQDHIQRLVDSVTTSLIARGITVQASRSLTPNGAPQRVQARWRKTLQNLSTLIDTEQAIVEEIAAAAVEAMHGSPRSRSSIESATHLRLSERMDISMSRMRVMTESVIARIEALMGQQNVDPTTQHNDAAENADGDIVDAANADYADSDPEADLQDLTKKGVDPSKPSKAKPGSEERILHIAACYAAGKPLWKPGDENEMTSPQDEEQSRRARVEASKQATDRVRADLAALKEY